MSDCCFIVPFHSINDVNSTITILVIGNYLGRVCENSQMMEM